MPDKTKENVHENHRQRLRDKFLENPNSLNKHEVLELLLFYAIPRKNVNPLAHMLLDKFGSLTAVLNATADELKLIDGMGDGTAAYITALGKTIDLISQEEIAEGLKFFNFENVKKYLIKFFANYDKEVFYAFFLSKTDKVIAKVSYTSDKVSEINFLLSEFSRSFANVKPYAVVVAHNHPSGNPEPSKKDDASTEKMYLMFALSGIKLYDHVIVAGNKIYSYNSDGRLDQIINSVNSKFDL